MHTVLLVEDERWVRTAVKRTIEKTGLPFRVLGECENGLEALDWLQGHSAELVMADIRMPVMDGLTFVDQLRERGELLPVIMLSGHDSFSYVQHALRSGVFDYLLKPVETEDMKACLSKWMKTRATSGASPARDRDATVRELSPVEQVVRLIRERLPGDISLTEAAAAVHLNPSYLSQLFKQRMNQTFVEYVLQARMDEAERLLAHTSLRISEIAERLGYADISYFSNTFKRLKGRPPSEYRKTAK
ncbi:AraC family transcriptional regulator [Gordoniibacillus kamchatkensis]|uniref:AraC family transcriptional regulator n=1 Tax=Gordoniibacillus kamchatkensis TaxID=1590651 RepID=A0ABR5AAA3_9BACL|nr:response regulator [Paenibacillus sp. VKM B-2647]KIL37907.1 AraC family transcriptional regulator [Paenibacillus sp. VKM B-2647]